MKAIQMIIYTILMVLCIYEIFQAHSIIYLYVSNAQKYKDIIPYYNWGILLFTYYLEFKVAKKWTLDFLVWFYPREKDDSLEDK